MVRHTNIPVADLMCKIKNRKICFAGNRKLKIFGTLYCNSGKRMNEQNRVFFISKEEAIAQGYRPCGHCMSVHYEKWKRQLINKQNRDGPI
ncbi:MAG: Ada metal-binding domain-containing protein [Ferruginibacter sp.]